MNYLRNSILATIVYYDIFDYPLTLLETHKYLVNPARVYRITGGLGEIQLNDISDELDRLVNSKILGTKNGFYFLEGRDSLFNLRMDRHKIADRKWKKFLRLANLFVLNPGLRGFFACGSMALSNTTKSSDFDVFVISRPDRLYTCRFFLWFLSSLMGVRRKADEGIAPDKFCFNHYITENRMALDYQSLYTAQLYSHLKPVYMSPEIFNNFFSSNIWMNNYLYNFNPQKEFVRRSINPSRIMRGIAVVTTAIFNSPAGDMIESVLKKYQKDRIMKNPLTGQPGGRVICTDTELEFHPHSFEQVVIDRYNKGLERLGITLLSKETDSGLTR